MSYPHAYPLSETTRAVRISGEQHDLDGISVALVVFFQFHPVFFVICRVTVASSYSFVPCLHLWLAVCNLRSFDKVTVLNSSIREVKEHGKLRESN